ncbi:MAG: hypothetical protein AAGK14_00330 [Verrucomicrobiota bacterium]
MDDNSLLDFSTIGGRRERVQDETYVEIVKSAAAPISSYEVAAKIGVPTHDVYPRLLVLVEKGKLAMPANDEFVVA